MCIGRFWFECFACFYGSFSNDNNNNLRFLFLFLVLCVWWLQLPLLKIMRNCWEKSENRIQKNLFHGNTQPGMMMMMKKIESWIWISFFLSISITWRRNKIDSFKNHVLVEKREIADWVKIFFVTKPWVEAIMEVITNLLFLNLNLD